MLDFENDFITYETVEMRSYHAYLESGMQDREAMDKLFEELLEEAKLRQELLQNNPSAAESERQNWA